MNQLLSIVIYHR